MHKLSESEIDEKIAELNNWTLVVKSIQKEFEFDNFSSAIGFVMKVAIESEKLDHHPDIFIHSWNKVKIILSTHSTGGLTDNDFILAEIIEALD